MAWTDNLFRWLGFGRYNSTLPTVAEGQTEELQVDQKGRLRVAVEAATVSLETDRAEPGTRYMSAALERQATAKATAGVLREITVALDGGAPQRYLQLFDRAAALAGGETPFFRSIVPGGGQVNAVFDGGYTLSNGLVVAVSSTLATWTDPAGDEAVFYAELD